MVITEPKVLTFTVLQDVTILYQSGAQILLSQIHDDAPVVYTLTDFTKTEQGVLDYYIQKNRNLFTAVTLTAAVDEWDSEQYVLPTASSTVKGGVKVGSGLTITDSVLAQPYTYTLPTATDSVLGGVKVGDGLEIVNGVLQIHVGTGLSLDTDKSLKVSP